jgi:hypothetical protein
MLRWLRLAVLLLLPLVAVGGLLAWWAYRASQRVPAFYADALRADPARQQQASDELLQQAAALANHARREGRWEALFTAEQINGWLAVDLLSNHAALLPGGVRDPRVHLRPDGAALACGWDNGRFSTVFSLECDLYLAEPNVVAVRVKGARAGDLPLPLDDVVDGLGRAAADLDAAVRWQQADGDPLALVTLPPLYGEDGGAIVVESLELRQDAIFFAGRTQPAGAPPDVAAAPAEERQPGDQQSVQR